MLYFWLHRFKYLVHIIVLILILKSYYYYIDLKTIKNILTLFTFSNYLNGMKLYLLTGRLTFALVMIFI